MRASLLCLTVGGLYAGLFSQASCGTEREIRAELDGRGKLSFISARGLADAELARAIKEDAANKLLSIYVIDEAALDLPPMAGTYLIEKGELRFTPRFPFRSATAYRAVLQPLEPGAKPLVKEFLAPSPRPGSTSPTRIATIYPTSAILPENLLKFYLHFTAPMGRGEAYERLKLLKSDGQAVAAPFLEIGEELWDTTGKRLTVLIDPGRIKKGVKPREDLGPALEAGQEYRLVIDGAWRDATGKPLAGGFEKRFKAGPPVEKELKIAEWKVAAPAADTKTALSVSFPQPLDHALLERTLSLTGPGGKLVPGVIAIANDERRWEFRPEAAWVPGMHRITINTVLEDLAGNRIGKAFEVDELRSLDKVIDVETVELSLLVK